MEERVVDKDGVKQQWLLSVLERLELQFSLLQFLFSSFIFCSLLFLFFGLFFFGFSTWMATELDRKKDVLLETRAWDSLRVGARRDSRASVGYRSMPTCRAVWVSSIDSDCAFWSGSLIRRCRFGRRRLLWRSREKEKGKIELPVDVGLRHQQQKEESSLSGSY